MLKFIGIGSCFNFEMGNTSAYYLDETQKSLLLIDCGESVFGEIGKKGLIDNLEKITVVITHLHSDHAGSLPSLVFYMYLKYGIKPDIIYPDKSDIIDKILFTVGEDMYNIYTPEEYNDTIGIYIVNKVKQKHSCNIKAYGYELTIEDKKIFYSGDTHVLWQDILNKFLNYEYNYFYHEVCKGENIDHHSIEELMKEIPEGRRKEVYCMHIADDELLQMVKQAGFSIPATE